MIGSFCYFVPEELIYAAGAVPVRLCSGYSETVTSAEELLPRDICPLVKSSFGFAIAGGGWMEVCDTLVIATSCDVKTKLGEYLSDYLPVWMLDLPFIKDYSRVKKYWVEEIKHLKLKIEKLTGNKITRQNLKTAVELLKKRAQLHRKLYELRLQNPALLAHQDLLMVIQAAFYDDIHSWLRQTEKLAEELKIRSTPQRAIEKKKLLLTGAPVIWPNFKILNIIEELGGSVVVDDMCVGHQRLWDYAEPDEWTMEGMLEGIASRYLFPSVCPCFTASYDRIDKILKLAKEANVNGVIYHDLRLCQLFDMERDLVNRQLKERNLPMLTLHTDYGQEDIEQLKNRIEPFLEIIR